ncbi:MAG: EAL domain-containing protein [Aquificae bacterium]|nr:EAL domain-containing protein [Aquificota bacterium]
MAKRIVVFEEEKEAEEFLKLARSMGIDVERHYNLVLVRTERDEELIPVFTELDTEYLRKMKILEEVPEGIDCEGMVKLLPKAKPIQEFIDKLIYDNLGKIFIDTKIYFQPIVDVVGKKVIAFEALCRPPIKIVDLINAGRNTSEFSESFCRDRALSRASELLGREYMLFLNFHPRFLKDPLKNFGDFISTLYMYGLNPNKVVVELTEYEEMNVNTIRSLISFLKSEGVKVALDDVGSGYSGLFYLSELKPDLIKIDMELIRNVHAHKLKKVIVNYLIRISHETGIKVVAEGIEKKEELDTVVYMGVDYVQGYLIGRPSEKPNPEEINQRVQELLSV